MFYLYDNVKRMVASYSYDDIGRLVSLKRSGNVGMVNYAYNIRNYRNDEKICFNTFVMYTFLYVIFPIGILDAGYKLWRFILYRRIIV